jgi:hypothetical protein
METMHEVVWVVPSNPTQPEVTSVLDPRYYRQSLAREDRCVRWMLERGDEEVKTGEAGHEDRRIPAV